MKFQSCFDISQGFFIAISLADNYAFNADRVRYITISVFFHDQFNGVHFSMVTFP